MTGGDSQFPAMPSDRRLVVPVTLCPTDDWHKIQIPGGGKRLGPLPVMT